tara:strand:+ start:2898 stop:3119 length:222 start_codon:yes stop_codon:yes gene_type:complete
MDIRKVSIGSDYKASMHYIVGQEVLNGSYIIHLIKRDSTRDSIVIYIQGNSEIIMWKEFTASMPTSIEYNINF